MSALVVQIFFSKSPGLCWSLRAVRLRLRLRAGLRLISIGMVWLVVLIMAVPVSPTVECCSNTGQILRFLTFDNLAFLAEKILTILPTPWVFHSSIRNGWAQILVVSGCLDFSYIPPSSRLQANNGTTLIVDTQNYPCHQIGMTIERDLPGHGKSFMQHAKGRRGVTAWTERPGQLALGDKMRLHRPEQWAWRPDGHALLL